MISSGIKYNCDPSLFFSLHRGSQARNRSGHLTTLNTDTIDKTKTKTKLAVFCVITMHLVLAYSTEQCKVQLNVQY